MSTIKIDKAPVTAKGTADKRTLEDWAVGITTVEGKVSTVEDLLDGTSPLSTATVLAPGASTPRTLAAWMGDTWNVRAFGAKGDGTTDDTAAIAAALAEAQDGDTVVFSGNAATRWRTTAPIVVGKNIRIRMGETYILADHAGIALDFDPAGNGKGCFGRVTGPEATSIGWVLDVEVSLLKGGTLWESGSHAIRISNSFHGRFRIHYVRGFETGLTLRGTTIDGFNRGSSYNRFDLGWIDAVRYGVVLTSNYPTSGWTTQNEFFAGSWTGTTSAVEGDNYVHPGSYRIFIDNAESNHFYAPSIEGQAEYGIRFANGSYGNTIYTPRFEMTVGGSTTVATHYLRFEGSQTRRNLVYVSGPPSTLLTRIYDPDANYNVVDSELWRYESRSLRLKMRPGDDWTTYLGTSYQAAVDSGFALLPLADDSPGVVDNGSVSGAVTLDLSKGRYHRFKATADVASVTRSNTPSLASGLTGAALVVEWVQDPTVSGGITIADVGVRLGSRFTLPTKRTGGRDIYVARYATTYGGETTAGWMCVGHHAVGSGSDAAQLTSLISAAEAFDESVWVKTGSSVTADTGAAPNGLVVADTIAAVTAGTRSVHQEFPATAEAHTASVWLRAGTTTGAYVALYDGASFAAFAGSKLSGPGTVEAGGSTTCRITGLSAVDWTRVAITGVLTAATWRFLIYVDATADGETIEAWGAQVVPGAKALAYSSADPRAAGNALMAAQADSVAADVATLKTDFNALLAKLRSSGLLTT